MVYYYIKYIDSRYSIICSYEEEPGSWWAVNEETLAKKTGYRKSNQMYPMQSMAMGNPWRWELYVPVLLGGIQV